MKSILMIIPNRNDATSLYRGSGPFAQINKTENYNFIFAEKVDTEILSWVDFVFMQRPCGDAHLKIAEMCKRTGTPLWIDYDDLLFDIPQDNPAYDAYMNQQTRNNLIKIIGLATVVTVSTEQLKRCLQPRKQVLNKRVYVIPNAMNDKWLKMAKPYSFKEHINWRGSRTHVRDVMTYGKEIVEISKQFPKSTFTFIGDNPWYLTEKMPPNQAIIVPPLPVEEYFEFICATNPSVQIVPLATSLFNMCKSNIAWMEAALSGAVTVAPDWQEWQKKPGVITYQNNADFKACVEYALTKPAEMKVQHEQAMEYIRENLLLSKVNEKRINLMSCLHEMSLTGKENFPEDGEPEPEGMQLE